LLYIIITTLTKQSLHVSVMIVTAAIFDLEAKTA